MFKDTGEVHSPTGGSPDGKYRLFTHSNAPTQADLWVLPLEGGAKPALLLRTEFQEGQAVFSPDGKWVAYASDEGKWQVSRDGGQSPRWTRDGKEIVFHAGAGKAAVAVNGSGSAFEAGIPQGLFVVATPAGYDVSPDGQKFVTTMPEGNRRIEETPITVALKWRAQLGR